MNGPIIVTTICLAVAAFAGCESVHRSHDGHGHVDLSHVGHAVAVLTPTAGNTARGVVTFRRSGSNVMIVADVSGLEPYSDHAWHVHEFGDIRGADGKATGGHYNPEGHPHGLPHDRDRHAGDLGNLTADANGHAHKEITVMNCSIGGPVNPVIGRAIIVHAKLDDGGQPTGNAGARIAQGVIGVAKTE